MLPRSALRWLPLSLLLAACAADEGTTPAPDATTADAASDLGALDAASDLGVTDAPLDVPGVDRSTPNDVAPDRADTGAPECGPSAPCPTGRVCVDGACARDEGPCTTSEDCRNDSRCVTSLGRCVGYDGGAVDDACTREVRPGVFAPAVQCRFSDAPAGDPFPEHLHVLATPMVADLRVYREADSPVRPSIIAVFDDGGDGGSENPTGLIRVLDGRTCALQENLSEQMVSHSSPPAVGDLDGDGVPEIVAFKAMGGLVAFRFETADVDAGASRGSWRVWWRSSRDGMPFNPTGGGWAGPTLVDIDGDGHPEVLRHGMVFDGRTGAYVGGDSVTPTIRGYSAGGFSVVLDVDEDGQPELVTASGVYAWDATMRDWVRESWWTRSGCDGAGCGEGHVAVANFGEYVSARFTDPGTPEIAVVSAGYVRVDTIEGRTVFGPVRLPGAGTGGPPTVADFDGDGLPEVAAAGAAAYSVFDPDCGPPTIARSGGRCDATERTGVLWSRPSQDMSSNVTGSTSFDFEADGRVEAVYADECFARVYDGRTGTVLFSQHHSSCTWYENPVVADVDGDFRAEIVVGSNFNCGSATTGINCPGVGPRGVDVQFAGIRCFNDADCPSGSCVEGFCRCTADAECCPGGAAGDGGAPTSECTYVCAAPPDGTPGTGNTCRAARPVGVRGIRVYSDVADRWVRSRMIWNQHVYNVTNVEDDGRIPASGAARRNWRDGALNNFRTNVQGSADTTSSPDATSAGTRVECLGSGAARLTARACNRGTAPLSDGLRVGFYDGAPVGASPVCTATTPRALNPGECVELTCEWATPPQRAATTVVVVVDDDRGRLECHEGNNLGTIAGVVCMPPG
ncbi:MAG: VCBS repeat-containing protein [Polyangiales bacterium]